jgi:F0F1-type ATP synthase membrane subunit a
MAGKIILGLVALLWAWWTYENISLYRHPEHFKAIEFLLAKCWAVVFTAMTVVGLWLESRKRMRP